MARERIIEILEPGLYVSTKLQSVIIKKGKEIIDRIPLEDLSVILLSGIGQTVTTNLIRELSRNGVMLIICDNKYLPSNILYPLQTNHQEHLRLQQQINISLPVKKNLWKIIIQSKIRNQSLLLRRFCIEDKGLSKLVDLVKSGDRNNYESQAAKRYWTQLFGQSYRRGNYEDSVNILLNFGYSLLRSVVARAIVASGLNPSLGVHHDNQFNSFCLADDIIEPFRVFVDEAVKLLTLRNITELNNETKVFLSEAIHSEILYDGVITSLNNSIYASVKKFVNCYSSGKVELYFPEFSEDGVIKNVNIGI